MPCQTKSPLIFSFTMCASKVMTKMMQLRKLNRLSGWLTVTRLYNIWIVGTRICIYVALHMQRVVSETLPFMERDQGKFHAHMFASNSMENSLLFVFSEADLSCYSSLSLENIYNIFPLFRTCFAPGGILFVEIYRLLWARIIFSLLPCVLFRKKLILLLSISKVTNFVFVFKAI
jgi:hypothetical protein